METAGKQMEDGELRDLLKENGIGRPSTRANIIETLFKRNYMRKEKKNIYATQTGIDLINTIQQELLKSAELTGQWEKRLRMIEKSTYDSATFMTELKTMVTEIVQSVKYDTQRTITIEEKKAEEEKKKTPKPRAKAPKKENTGEPQPATEAKQAQPQPQPQQAAPLPATIVGMTCPLCGKGTIVKGRTAYGCSDWKAGCALRLPIEMDGKEQTTEELLKQLRALKQ
jgi:DNA topoisomerase-3